MLNSITGSFAETELLTMSWVHILASVFVAHTTTNQTKGRILDQDITVSRVVARKTTVMYRNTGAGELQTEE
jgi:hypothetical protein